MRILGFQKNHIMEIQSHAKSCDRKYIQSTHLLLPLVAEPPEEAFAAPRRRFVPAMTLHKIDSTANLRIDSPKSNTALMDVGLTQDTTMVRSSLLQS